MSTSQKRRAMIIRKKKLMKRRFMISMFCIVFLFMIFSGFIGINANAKSNDAPEVYKYYTGITVKSGDSLWAYAETYAPDGNYEKYIKEVMNINNLNSDKILPGYYIIVPYYSTEYKP